MDVAFVFVAIIFMLICILLGLICAWFFAQWLRILGYKRKKRKW